MPCYVIGKVDDFIHEMEDHLRKGMIGWRLEGKKNDLNGIGGKVC
jgi:hypothetical protein